MAHQGYEAVQVGPWVAKDVDVAANLLHALLGEIGNGKVYLDIPCINREGIQLLGKAGFRIQREFSRMFLGENKAPGIPSNVYGTSGAEKG